ncbi:MAG: NADP-dependent phosphogluconate dehydrogenase [Terrimonas sp.]|nr:NADP-dependent phosphogluconate dehydrogenase [Terrimonas sp.]
METYNFGMIGLGVMGRNFLLNMADNGFKVIGFDKDSDKAASLEKAATKGTVVKGVDSLETMLDLLESPRKIMMLVPAGKPVDEVIESLLPLLDRGDVVIDGGNSHFTDTLRRVQYLEQKGIHFMGMGVSGGEEGARKGPSIMPGGDAKAYKLVRPMLEAVAAKVNGEPCVAYMGNGAAGHYVKMVHNGIEYAIMQLISEIYDFLHRGGGLDNDELHQVFKQWNEGELQSFLVEITADIFLQKDDKTENRLIDMIMDRAGSKGTGKWTSQDAMELPVAVPVIDMAVAMRILSAYKEERVAAADLYVNQRKPVRLSREQLVRQAHDALYFSIIVCYAQGLAMLHQASLEWKMEIPMKEVVKIWRGGCIIRSSLLETFYKAYRKNKALPNILLDKTVARLIRKKEKHCRNLIKSATQHKIVSGALCSSLAYFDAYTSEWMPVNLIQAQRDYFGAHTYERTDREGKYHTNWEQFNQ